MQGKVLVNAFLKSRYNTGFKESTKALDLSNNYVAQEREDINDENLKREKSELSYIRGCFKLPQN